MLTTWRLTLICLCLGLVACGPVETSNAQPAPDCVVQTTGLLALNEVPMDLKQQTEGTSPVLGLLGNGDSAYPGFIGRSQRDFLWTGLYDGTPRALVDQAWSDLHYGSTAPVGFIPSTGALFATYPGQVFRVAEATMDFGSVEMAQKWLVNQQSMNMPNNDPKTRNGVETNPPTVKLGDDTFAYQLTHGPSGDVFTDVQSRVGSIVYAISIDGGPSYDGVTSAVALNGSLHAKEHATCGVG